MSRRASWITKRALGIGTSPADTKELPALISQPYQPASDTERYEFEPGYPDVAEGFNRTSSDVKNISKIVIRHPEHPHLILYGMRRDNGCWSNPGGHADPGEAPIDTMFREFKEECGMELISAEYVACIQIEEAARNIHIFEGQGPAPDVWAMLNNDDDPDSEYICFQYIDPHRADVPFHIPRDRDGVLFYLESGGDWRKEGLFFHSLRDLTTDKEANQKRGQILPPASNISYAGTGTDIPKKPDVDRFQRTDESQYKSYSDNNQFEDPDLKLGSQEIEARMPAYDSGGMSPADDMLESLGDVQIVQHASQNYPKEASMMDMLKHEGALIPIDDGIATSVNPGVSTENSKGLTVQMENERADFDLLRDRSVRIPV